MEEKLYDKPLATFDPSEIAKFEEENAETIQQGIDEFLNNHISREG